MGLLGSLGGLASIAAPVVGVVNPAAGMALGAAGGAMQTADANKQNRQESARNRVFQERMSNTAHQRQVEDMRLAGLNPILSAKFGGASTPSGSVATFQSTAKDVREGAMIRDQIEHTRADTSLKQQNADTAQALMKLYNRQAQGVHLENQLKQIDVDFFTSAEPVKIAQRLGVSVGTAQKLVEVFKMMKVSGGKK